MKKKVTVIGAGHVGATLAQYIAMGNLADVVLVDILEGVPQGNCRIGPLYFLRIFKYVIKLHVRMGTMRFFKGLLGCRIKGKTQPVFFLQQLGNI